MLLMLPKNSFMWKRAVFHRPTLYLSDRIARLFLAQSRRDLLEVLGCL